ncbi:MAG: hypothetical protein Q6M54_07975 [Thermostichus sp. DRC_bins_24]
MSSKVDLQIDLQTQELKGEICLIKVELEGKISMVQAEIQQVRTDLKGDIEQVRTELKGEIERVNAALKRDIERVNAELGSKVDAYGKRLEQQEFVSRGAIVALVVGVIPVSSNTCFLASGQAGLETRRTSWAKGFRRWVNLNRQNPEPHEHSFPFTAAG